jgi:hypothetical protein
MGRIKRQVGSGIIFLSLMNLFGCVMPYKSVETGPTAKLRVMMKKDDYLFRPFFYPDGTCDSKRTLGVLSSEYFGPEGKGEGSQLNMIDGKSERDPTRKERIIPAEKEFSIELSAHGGTPGSFYYCEYAFSFFPEVGGEYEILHDIQDKKCSLAINELKLGGNGQASRIPIKAKKREFLKCFI